ncbi:MAG: polyketide synthase dehydratase domain-containing protein, partial [Phaeodactylibacter sp.]|nr:polyketide synthase dehydratase domain-containing protein [Phaeodactylibacter sp.]
MLHTGALFKNNQHTETPVDEKGLLDTLIREGTSAFSPKTFYQELAARGIQYGPAFQGVQEIWQRDGEALARIYLPEILQDDAGGYLVHPAFLDACLQAIAAVPGAATEGGLFMPVGCRRIRLYSKPGQLVWSRVTLLAAPQSGAGIFEADIRVYNEQQELLLELLGFQLQRISKGTSSLFSRSDTWLYHLQWQPQEWPVLPPSSDTTRNWLILVDEEGLGAALATRLEADGDRCTIRSSSEGLEEILDAVAGPIHGIVYLWGLSIPAQALDARDTTQAMHRLGHNGLLLLVQALSKRPAFMPRLWLVTRGAQAVSPGEAIAVEQSTLWGLGKVISFELPELKCQRIDLDPSQDAGTVLPVLHRQLLTESPEDQIAFRSEERYVLRLLPFGAEVASRPVPAALRPDATYLITGGLGGLGLATASWMVTQGVRHLVLLGRSAPSTE